MSRPRWPTSHRAFRGILARSSLLLFSTLTVLGALFPVPASATVSLKPNLSAEDGGPKWRGGTFPDTSFEGIRYVSSQVLEGLFGREGSWVPDRQKFVIPDTSGRKWYFTIDNPYMNIGDEVVNLVYPVRRGAEFLYLPVTSLVRLLNQRMGLAITIPEAVQQVQEAPAKREKAPSKAIGLPGGSNILDIGTEDRENGTLVSVRTAGPMEYESFWVPPHFILKFQGGLLAPQFPFKAQGQGLVKNIMTVQEKDMVQLTLNIPRAIDTVEVAYSGESQGYQVTVRKKSDKSERREKEKDKATAESEAAATGGQEKGRPGKISTIIIDPGHGGKDQGAMVGGVNEAQVTLAVAKELKAALGKLGYKALMTREDDQFISLPDRPKFASEKGGDLFISLHCNSIGGSMKRKKTVSGFIAYILREGESEEDKALARRENEAISEESGKSKGEISPVEWILLEHQLNLYSHESEGFAEQIIREFGDFQIGKYATGASQAGFYVLVGAYMPAVLFEMGYLTNDEDRRILSSEKGQKQIAERLSKSIDAYRKAMGGSTAKEGKAKRKGEK
ncbi:MAG: N-acetylmuramoyl-L-alanine amidase family protein [Fibrobacteres bacterium]|nr:N-acetylmuramoyl-L-alanine amidase family protein [Fibrobacterota bacterium]